MNERKSHRALLEIILEKERDLNRIRQVADSAAEDEMATVQRQLQTLQLDYNRSNDTIKTLQQHIYNLEEEYEKSKESIERKCQETSEQRVMELSIRNEKELRKRLGGEFDERLTKKEQDLEREYSVTVVEELRDQETRMREQFDRFISDIDHQHSHETAELKATIQKKDAEVADLTRLNEKRMHDLEYRLRREARDETDAEIKSQLEACERRFQSSMSILEDEKDQIMQELHQTKQIKSNAETENRDLRCKIDELLGILQNTESEYSATIGAVEARKHSMVVRINELQDQVSQLEMASRDAEDECMRRTKIIERQSRAEKKDFENVIKKLKHQLELTKDEKEDVLEAAKEKENEMENSKSQLKEKLSLLKRECKSLRRHINTMQEKSSAERRTGSATKGDIELALFEKERENNLARQRLVRQFEDTIKSERETWNEHKLRLTRDRDEIMIEKEGVVRALEKKRIENDSLRAELSSLRQRQRVDDEVQTENLREARKRNKMLQEENGQLKESVRAMRSEMELLIAFSAEEKRRPSGPQEATLTRDQNQPNSVKHQHIHKQSKER